jgi:hypothetical protein
MSIFFDYLRTQSLLFFQKYARFHQHSHIQYASTADAEKYMLFHAITLGNNVLYDKHVTGLSLQEKNLISNLEDRSANMSIKHIHK